MKKKWTTTNDSKDSNNHWYIGQKSTVVCSKPGLYCFESINIYRLKFIFAISKLKFITNLYTYASADPRGQRSPLIKKEHENIWCEYMSSFFIANFCVIGRLFFPNFIPFFSEFFLFCYLRWLIDTLSIRSNSFICASIWYFFFLIDLFVCVKFVYANRLKVHNDVARGVNRSIRLCVNVLY